MRVQSFLIKGIIAILVLMLSAGCGKKFIDSRILLDDAVRQKPVEVTKKPKPKPDTFEAAKPEKAPLPPVITQPTIIEERLKEEEKSIAELAEPKIVPAEVVEIGLQDIFFDYDRFYIRNDAETVMEKNIEYLLGNPDVKVKIEGYCDERGTAEYNIALGEERARAAKEYLVKNGIAPDRISTVSYGKERPFCNEHNEECWQANRRVHFVEE